MIIHSFRMDKYKILFHCHILCDPKWREKKLNFLQVLITIKKQRQWNYEMRKKLFKSNKINPFHCRKKCSSNNDDWQSINSESNDQCPNASFCVFFTSLSYMTENCINFISLHQSHVVCLYSLKKIFHQSHHFLICFSLCLCSSIHLSLVFVSFV